MQSIKNFLKPSWIKFAIMVAFPVMIYISFFDSTALAFMFLFSVLLWPIMIIEIWSVISYLLIAIYWYLLACLIIFISKKTKIGKEIIIALPIVIISLCLCSAIFIPRPNYSPPRDGRIAADMNQIRSEAQIVELEDYGSYAGVCIDNDVVDLIEDIDGYAPSSASCFAEKDAYCVTVELNSGDYYCVDSKLNSISGPSNSCTKENKSCE